MPTPDTNRYGAIVAGLVDRIRQLWPGIRIICTSGYVWPANQDSDAAYLQKPFTSQDLLLKVKNILSTEH